MTVTYSIDFGVSDLNAQNHNMNDSIYSKARHSIHNIDPTAITIKNEPDIYLAVGPEQEKPKTQEQQMEELREHFK